MRSVTTTGGEEARGQGYEAASLHAAALAAGLLAEAWSPAPETPPTRASVTRELALTLRADLEALTGGQDDPLPWNVVVEGALRAADVANLAAASLLDLSGTSVHDAVAATHLAAGASKALCALVGGEGAEGRTEYALKDARSAAWRAGLAARQADEALEGMRGSIVRRA